MGVNQIVCCSDFSDHSEAAFQTALDLAQRYNAKLYVVHVLPPVVNPMLTDADLMLPEHERTDAGGLWQPHPRNRRR